MEKSMAVVLIIVSLKKSEMTKKQKTKTKSKTKKNIYDKPNTFTLQQKEAVLVAFRISKLGPWKLMENFLILVPHCGK